MSIPIRYRMVNSIDGEVVVLEGGGNLMDGKMSLSIRVPKMPVGWDPIILPCICSGPGPGTVGDDAPRRQTGGLISLSPGGYRTTEGTYRVAKLFDGHGAPVAEVRATGVYARKPAELDFDISVETHLFQHDVLQRLTAIDYYSFTIIPLSPNQVLVHSHYGLSGPDNLRVSGLTEIHYDLLDSTESKPIAIFGRNALDVKQENGMLFYNSMQQTWPIAYLHEFTSGG